MRCLILYQSIDFFKKIFNIKKSNIPIQLQDLSVIPRNKHTISRDAINLSALKVLYRLNKNGYEAYLVGGSVRDLLLGKQPKDFDVTTNATPEQIQKLFRNCRLIGRRFRLAHIMFGREVIEVATFRAAPSKENDVQLLKQSQSGMLLRDNVYGTIEEDALRRDFTINSLYYSVKDFTVRDYCNGLHDLKEGIIRIIGDPETRYREDPVRMLRAIRFSAKLEMAIEEKTQAAIHQFSHLLKSISSARLYDESLKLLQSGCGFATYQLLVKHTLFDPLFPTIAACFTPQKDSNMEKLIEISLKNTDARLQQGKRINSAFLFACMLWYPAAERASKVATESGLPYYDAFSVAASEVLTEQSQTIMLQRRITTTVLDIWYLQLRLAKRTRRRVYIMLNHEKFRAAFDLLELRASIEKGNLVELTQWWQQFQTASSQLQETMIKAINAKDSKSAHYKRKPTYTKKVKDVQ